jgi:hypothetical protein
MPSTTRAAAPLPLLGADAPPVRVGLPSNSPNPTELLVEAARSASTTQVGVEVDERLGADQWILLRACETRRNAELTRESAVAPRITRCSSTRSPALVVGR